MEAQGYSITRPPSSSLWAAFDPVALWHELNGDRRTNFYGVWYWRPTDAPSPIDQWRADADSIPLNPVPTDTVSAVAEAELQAALGYAARDIAIGQIFKYAGKYLEKLPDGSFGILERFPGTVAVRVKAVLEGRGFGSFTALKRFLGPAGENKQWHHIVEQSKLGQFGAELIHNTGNIVSLPRGVHEKISAYYSSIQDFTDGKTVRDWLKGLSFDEQWNFGIKTIDDFTK